MIAGLWRLPLLSSMSGHFLAVLSENRRRGHVVRLPCRDHFSVHPVIDEMEKAFSFGDGDSGTGQRVFASLLTWMQDKTAPCFVVATAKQYLGAPPRAAQKGRFDRFFSLTFPPPPSGVKFSAYT